MLTLPLMLTAQAQQMDLSRMTLAPSLTQMSLAQRWDMTPTAVNLLCVTSGWQQRLAMTVQLI